MLYQYDHISTLKPPLEPQGFNFKEQSHVAVEALRNTKEKKIKPFCVPCFLLRHLTACVRVCTSVCASSVLQQASIIFWAR